jgi:mono/diheme cytochrome c family protein
MKRKFTYKRNPFILGISLLMVATTYMTCRTPYTPGADNYSKVGPAVNLPEGADPEGPDWKGIDLAPKAPTLPLSPSDQAKKFVLQPGYTMEPILTEPQIEQPGAISFDGNGRMFVLELRSYMLDADATDELEPTSRISRWEDKNNDGVYETGTVFVDSLVFARFVLPYGKDAILTMESNTDDVYKYTDTNGDGVADKKELFVTRFGRSGNVEHQQAFLYWGMDNWLYSTYNAFRVRFDASARETTGTNGAAWGVTQDDDGKIWFQGGASGVPTYFQFPIHYGRFNVEDQLAEGFRVPWGSPVLISDMQGGMDQIRMPDGSLNSVTGGAGNDVFRGTRLPAELVGQYFYGEPVARIVRQINPVITDGLTQLHNVYQDRQQEFIRSTDPLFRPVDMTTAPDGTMYITDMYHGIIQQGQWTPKGSYLRTKIEQYQLDKAVNMGRIWRLTYKGMDRDKTQPRMLDETSAQLVAHLDHPNGWWRDMAQQLIILNGDRSVVPALEQMARTDKNLLARFHAMWTLEGLGALKPELVRELMKESNPRLQIQAIRASESLYKNGDHSFENDYKAFAKNSNTDIALQAIMTLNTLKVADAEVAIKATLDANKARGIQLIGNQILNPPTPTGNNANAMAAFNATEQESLKRGAVIYNELCSECHGDNGTGTLMGPGVLLAPSLAGNPRVQGNHEYVTKVILKGLAGSIEGKDYAGGVMVPMAEHPDEWIADIISYIRNNFGNSGAVITTDDIAEMRTKVASQEGFYTYDDLITSIPKAMVINSNWNITASHAQPTLVGGKAAASGAFSFEGWTTGVKQVPNMWFQVEMPGATTISGLEFDSPTARSQATATTPATTLETYPREFIVEVSTDGNTWTKVAERKGTSRKTWVAFKPVQAKFVKITQKATAENDSPWRMQAMKLYQVASNELASN